ncbi:MAG: hypothetical protein AAGF49_06215, partial [Pseudomonadota bacterium]
IDAQEEGGPRAYQPMNVNFGLFPPVERQKSVRGSGRAGRKHARKTAYCERARADFTAWGKPGTASSFMNGSIERSPATEPGEVTGAVSAAGEVGAG